MKSKMHIKTGMRIDQELVMRGLVESRTRAKRLIENGKVRLNGEVETKTARSVSDEDGLEVIEPEVFVSRAGEKLEAAMEKFQLNVSGANGLDIGASTGGFTDCLLQRGVAKVVAVDVGHDQMVEHLRKDNRVTLMEGVNARNIKPDNFQEHFDIIVIDVSFISLEHIIPPAVDLASTTCNLIALIKPQFEVGKDNVGSGGIVREEAYHEKAVKKITKLFSSLEEWEVQEIMASPVVGSDGNQEFLIWAKK